MFMIMRNIFFIFILFFGVSSLTIGIAMDGRFKNEKNAMIFIGTLSVIGVLVVCIILKIV